MRKNEKHSALETIIFADRPAEVKWAIKFFKRKNIRNFSEYIIPTSDDSQVEMLNNGLSPAHFLELIPSITQRTDFLKTASKVSDFWINDPSVKRGLTFNTDNFGYYLTNHWMNLLPILLNSMCVIDNVIKKYKPKKIIYFEKEFDFSNSYLEKTPESLILNFLQSDPEQALTIESIKIKDIRLRLPSKISINNISRYFDFMKEDIFNFYLIIKIIAKNILSSNQKLGRSDLLIIADKHNLIGSAPLIRILKEKRVKAQIVGVSLLLSHKVAALKNDLNYFDYNNAPKKMRLNVDAYNFASFWKKYKKSKNYVNFIKEFNLEPIAPIISYKLDLFFSFNIKSVLNNYWRCRKLVEKVRPEKLLIFSNYGQISLSAALAVKKIGGEVIVLQHGIIPLPKTIYTPVMDKMLVWGTIEKGIHNRIFHIPLKKIKIVGWYYSDPLVTLITKNNESQDSSSRRGLKKILFVSNLDHINNGTQVEIVLRLIKVIAQLKKYKLIVRPHPGQTISKQLATIVNNHLKIDTEWDFGKDLDSQIKSSDIVITQATTVGLRAMLWQKPVIHLVPPETIDICEFSKYGAAIKLTDISKLRETIVLLDKDDTRINFMIKAQKRLLADYAYKLDGRSSERVVQEILRG